MTATLRLPRLAGALAAGALVGIIALGGRRRRRSLQRVRDALSLLRSGQTRDLWRAIRVRVFARARSIGFQRDLTIPFPAPAAGVPLIVRPFAPQDRLTFLDSAPGLPARSAWSRSVQRRLLDADLPPCWIGVTPNGIPCYMQWLFTAKDNARIRARWGELFPELKPDEALVEGIFTAEDHRRQGIMGHALARVADAAKEFGVRRVFVFVSERNHASLKGCEKAGFTPYVERRETRFLFQNKVRFTPLA